MVTDRAFTPVKDQAAVGLSPGGSTPRPNVGAEAKAILRTLWGNDFFVSVLRASWRGASRFSERRIIRPAHHPGSVRKFLPRGTCFPGYRRVGDDIPLANQELIRDGLPCFSGALALIALAAFTSKNFSQGDVPSFKLLDYLALAVGFSTILRRAYATNASRG
jgi:hypothetical protein